MSHRVGRAYLGVFRASTFWPIIISLLHRPTRGGSRYVVRDKTALRERRQLSCAGRTGLRVTHATTTCE